jgi:hypothetical protein
VFHRRIEIASLRSKDARDDGDCHREERSDAAISMVRLARPPCVTFAFDTMTITARRRLAGLGLLLLIVATAATLALPMWLIRPFAPQTPRAVAAAFWIRRLAPWTTVLAVLATIVLAAWLWRGARWWTRLALPVVVAALAYGAWMARQNLFEKMFAPLPATRFAPAAEASWVADDEPVLAIALGGEARAYPVRQVAYHHVVNDTVGGVPIAATY